MTGSVPHILLFIRNGCADPHVFCGGDPSGFSASHARMESPSLGEGAAAFTLLPRASRLFVQDRERGGALRSDAAAARAHQRQARGLEALGLTVAHHVDADAFEGLARVE